MSDLSSDSKAESESDSGEGKEDIVEGSTGKVQGEEEWLSDDDEPRLLWQQQHPKLGESLGN